jgi:hypothetical protein
MGDIRRPTLGAGYVDADQERVMKKNYYDASSLELVLTRFEDLYGMTSAEFYVLVERGEDTPGIPGFHRHSWASFYRDVRRLRGYDFAANAGRVLAAV